MAESGKWGVIEDKIESLYPTLDSVHTDRQLAEDRVGDLMSTMTEDEMESGVRSARVVELGIGTVRKEVTVITDYTGPDGVVYSMSSTSESSSGPQEFTGWGYETAGVARTRTVLHVKTVALA